MSDADAPARAPHPIWILPITAAAVLALVLPYYGLRKLLAWTVEGLALDPQWSVVILLGVLVLLGVGAYYLAQRRGGAA